ncbi:MAG TPA: hypothetical protein VIN09_01520, partial [Chloroflexota bacterium]
LRFEPLDADAAGVLRAAEDIARQAAERVEETAHEESAGSADVETDEAEAERPLLAGAARVCRLVLLDTEERGLLPSIELDDPEVFAAYRRLAEDDSLEDDYSLTVLPQAEMCHSWLLLHLQVADVERVLAINAESNAYGLYLLAHIGRLAIYSPSEGDGAELAPLLDHESDLILDLLDYHAWQPRVERDAQDR